MVEVPIMRIIMALLASLTLALLPQTASAHAHLDRAVPAVGSTVPTPPQDVTLTFTQNLEAAFSSVTVTDAGGARVDQGSAKIDGNTMQIGLKTLTAGTFTVHWQAVSVDTHKTEGTFNFSIGGN
jgi:methionine-rich copper-binding protein CopC